MIEANPEAIFGKAASWMAPNVKKAFELFLKRKPEDKAIEAMGHAESADKDGFRYKRTW